MFEVFTANTFAGEFHIAVKFHKDFLPGDSRADAYAVMVAEFGRCGRILPGSAMHRRLSKAFWAVKSAPDWGFIARAA